MSRLRRIEQSHRFFFVTTNLAKDTPLFSAAERTLVLADLRAIGSTHDFLLLAFLVMPDHLHLMIYPRETTLTGILRDFKSKSAQTIRKSRNCLGPIWQSHFFDFICRRVSDYWSKVEYIHQNLVTDGLVESPEAWAWSSAAACDTTPCLLGPVPDKIELPLDGDALLWPAPSR
jgi:putative transposase